MEAHYLPHAIIELTPQCNLRCTHCYNGWKSPKKKTPIQQPYKKTLTLLNYLFRTTRVENIIFTGGEPTLYHRFAEVVLHTKMAQKKVTVITNGNGSKEIYKQLAKLFIDRIQFSIHSYLPSIHDSMTQLPGSWLRANSSMQYMLEQGTAITIVMVITSLNYLSSLQSLAYFYEAGIRSFMINRYNIGGKGIVHWRDLSATAQQIRQVFYEIDTFGKQHPDCKIVSGVCTPHCLLLPTNYPHIRFSNCPDSIYKHPLTFDLDGNMRMCNHSPQVAGNIFQESWEHIFSSNYVNSWADINIPHCQLCSHILQCKGGCRAASEQRGFSIQHEDPIIKLLDS